MSVTTAESPKRRKDVAYRLARLSREMTMNKPPAIAWRASAHARSRTSFVKKSTARWLRMRFMRDARGRGARSGPEWVCGLDLTA